MLLPICVVACSSAATRGALAPQRPTLENADRVAPAPPAAAGAQSAETSTQKHAARPPAVPVHDAEAFPVLFVGSGDWGTATGAVTSYRLDPATGQVARRSRIEAGGLLSFLAIDAEHRFLYAADEEQKQLRSFALDGPAETLTPTSMQATESGPVYVGLTRDTAYLLAAQFVGGATEIFQLDGAGGFVRRSAAVASGAESHSVYLSPDERFVFVPGRASHRVSRFRFDSSNGTLAAAGGTSVDAGAGCRHMTFDLKATHAYLVNEFANTVTVFDYNARSGTLTRVQSVSTLPDGFRGKSSAADIHLHPNGRFLYVTNRPTDTDGNLAVLAVSSDDGKLTRVGHESTYGRVPRNFTIQRDGRYLVVGNQESKTLVTFALDAGSGKLTLVGQAELDVKPFFVSFLLAG
jgi:6-phosphogluconolactonase